MPNKPEAYFFPLGMTVTELKKLIADWPEVDGDGQPNEVWMMTGKSLSSPITDVVPLNARDKSADIVFSCGLFTKVLQEAE